MLSKKFKVLYVFGEWFGSGTFRRTISPVRFGIRIGIGHFFGRIAPQLAFYLIIFFKTMAFELGKVQPDLTQAASNLAGISLEGRK